MRALGKTIKLQEKETKVQYAESLATIDLKISYTRSGRYGIECLVDRLSIANTSSKLSLVIY